MQTFSKPDYSNVQFQMHNDPFFFLKNFQKKRKIKHAKKKEEAGGKFPHKSFQTENQDWEANQTQQHANGWRRHGEEEKGAKKERVKTLSNSTVTLKPRLLSFLDSSTSNSSPGRRLLTPGALPFKLSWVYSCEAEEQGIKLNYNKQEHAVRERGGKETGGREGRSSCWYFSFTENMQWKQNRFAPALKTQRCNHDRQLVTSKVVKK